MLRGKRSDAEADVQIRRTDSPLPNTLKKYNVSVLGENYFQMITDGSLPRKLTPEGFGINFSWHELDQDMIFFHDAILRYHRYAAIIKKHYKDPNTSITLIFPKDNNELVTIFNSRVVDYIKGSCFIILPEKSDITEVPKNNLNAQIASFPTQDEKTFLEAVLHKHLQTFASFRFESMNKEHIDNAMRLATFFQCYRQHHQIASLKNAKAEEWPLSYFPNELILFIAQYIDPDFDKTFREFLYQQQASLKKKDEQKLSPMLSLFQKVIEQPKSTNETNSKKCSVM